MRELWERSETEEDAFARRREKLSRFFRAQFGGGPQKWVSSPGRAEIVGNHTDHNGGKVLVSALSCDILCAASAREDELVEIASEDFYPVRISLHDLGMREREKGKSVALARGVLRFLADRGYPLRGFSACTHSTVFRGAGVSSSAAFELAVAELADRFCGGTIPPLDKALAGNFAENRYFGKTSGLLDQAGIAFGGLNYMDLGTFPPAVESLPPPEGYRLVLTNTGGSHAGMNAQYNDIRREMADVAAFFGKKRLRDVSEDALFSSLPALRKSTSDRAILRAVHFFRENARVERAADALKRGDLSSFFAQVRESGQSSLGVLQNCYPPAEIAQPVVIALQMSERLLGGGAYRMMGGGFTGTVIAFCRKGEERRYGKEMARVFGRENVFYADLRKTGVCEIL